MKEEQKSQLIAEAENVEAIRDFFSEWYSVEELYETMAKACTTLIYQLNRSSHVCDDDKKVLEKFLMQHEMMIEHMKPFARKEGEV